MNYSTPRFVYFARRGPYVKIGISNNPAVRAAHLRRLGAVTLNPADAAPHAPVDLLHTIPGCTLGDESFAQKRFHRWHVEGEWYRLDDELLAELDVVIEETAAGRTPRDRFAEQFAGMWRSA